MLSEEERNVQAVDLLQRVVEQERQAFNSLSDKLSSVRARNRALLEHVGELVEENKRLRLSLANALNGDF